MTGNIRELPLDLWLAHGGSVTLEQLSLYDSPVLIAEKTAQAIQLEP